MLSGETMTNKQFKILTKSKHFIYFVTEEDENINWCLKIAAKDRFASKFKKAVIDETTGYKVILKIKLAIIYQPNYMKLNAYNDSPYKMKDLEPEYKKEIKKAIIKTNTTYCDEIVPYYDYAIVLWEELNDKEKFYLYETPKQELAWLTEPFDKKQTGLPMNVELSLQSIGKIVNEHVYLIVQNDYEDKQNLNWFKIRIDDYTILEDKKPIFTDDEMNLLKLWIEVNKLPILMQWTQTDYSWLELSKLIKPVNVIEPIAYLDDKKDWKSTRIIHAKELEEYFETIKPKIIGKTIDRIFYTGNLYNKDWDSFGYKYKNGEWTDGEKIVNPPAYYEWKDRDVLLELDSPVILDFEGEKFEILYWTGSLVNVNMNSIDLEMYGADVSRHFAVNIIGHKLVDIKINKTKKVYFMNFDSLGIDRKNGDDMFEEIWFVFDNGYALELTTDHTDYTYLSEIHRL